MSKNITKDLVTKVSDRSNYNNVGEFSSEKDWLVGSPELDTWKFSEYLHGQYNGRLTFSWNPTFESVSTGDKVRWESWKRFAKRFCIALFDNDEGLSKTVTYKNNAQNIKSACQFFCFIQKCSGIESVSIEDVREYEGHISKRNLSVSSVCSLLNSFKLLWTQLPLINSGLLFDPYPINRKINTVAKVIGNADSHTKTLLPNQGLILIDYALKVIKDSEQILEHYNAYIHLKKKQIKHSRIFKRKFGYGALELFSKVDSLYGAAIVIVLSLSAMRLHEISCLKYDDALKIVDGKVNTLTGKVHKTARTVTGKKTERCVVNEVVDALKIILCVTRHIREINSNPILLLKTPLYNSFSGRGVPVEELGFQSLYILLDKFANNVGYDDGTLRPHMFRRFFAMMWTWRFELGDLEYLSQLLYHNGREFTEAYTEDEKVWEFMPEEIRKLTYDVFEEMLSGKVKIAGGFSKTVTMYKRILSARVTIVEPENVSGFANRIISKHGYIVIPAADGYCFISSARGARSNCSTNGITPNYSNRSENSCASCPNFGVTDDRKTLWESRLAAHKLVFETTQSKELRIASEKGREICRKMLKKINS